MSKGSKYNTKPKYWKKRINKPGWSWGYYTCRVGGGGKSGKFPFSHIRRSKFFKNLDCTRISMRKLWMREYWYWDI